MSRWVESTVAVHLLLSTSDGGKGNSRSGKEAGGVGLWDFFLREKWGEGVGGWIGCGSGSGLVGVSGFVNRGIRITESYVLGRDWIWGD